ncbi:hypothetical protein EUTSA_v10005827mg [Eutrema salsugineum]|uniref:BZIP domain-containing protein n=1 Tax=Eutrema salsugineum TaxID=72664 RepID=V4L296_EUTSA|nr:bZIP transcription factor 49 [Eutrema salsugineum]ESQ44415.1 hypothetical protein EUTSA_v10005827mg [Eutrema salsugineum]
MAEPVMVEKNHTPDTDPSTPCFSSEFDSIANPPPPFADNFYNSSSDRALIGKPISDLRFLIDGDGDFELIFDSVDDLYFPSENESFVIPVGATNGEISGDFTPVTRISGDRVLCCNLESPRDSDCSGTARSLSLSSQESANGVSDVSEATIASSVSGIVAVDQKFKTEEEASTTSTRKRKKESEEETSEDSRNSKYRRSDEDGVASIVTGGEEDDEKRNARLIRNRESAQLSRQRKKHYVEELEEKVKNMHSTITQLKSKISYFVAENATLRQQVGSGRGMCWKPSGMYPPLAPMPYPWMPCPAYMAKPQGSQVPLLPIPRLKPQQSSVAKVKKSEGKTKKVASISVLGLVFCLFLFGALAPILNFSYGGTSGVFYGEYDRLRGRALDVSGHCGRYSDQGVRRNVSATVDSVSLGNGSEPLAASLFVPRNEKLVKIDGNLIIHSVLASEKAMVSVTKNEGQSGVELTKGFSPSLPKHLYSEKQKGLSSSNSDDSSEDQLESTTANGKMQQWFREGVAGPLFGSGMCTEVFQFDVSSTSGVIIPASPATQQPKNTTDSYNRKNNRRILRGGLPVSDLNLAKDQNSSSKENFRTSTTKPDPSMVVSMLVDPREGSDGDTDGTMRGTKSLPRVFVVVLVDGMKYVTYSCLLPRPEVPHLVTT